MKRISTHPSLHYLFLLLWLLLNLVQAGFTELSHDEAYYWLYAKYLNWGHFHQPPMIGWLIRAGYTFFDNELGVRLASVLLSTCSLHLLQKMLSGKDVILFWTIIFSTFLINIGGFFAVPDSPLFFFTVLFLYGVQKFLRDKQAIYALFLGVIAAAIIYSKYHGIMLMGAAVLVNLNLLKKPVFWLIPVVSLVLLIPHIYWQVDHQFPGFQYHAKERFGEAFEWEHISAYPLGQLIILGPLTGFILLWSAFAFKPATPFERTLKWCMILVFGFLFLVSFYGRVEANWTVCGFIPLIIIGHAYLSKHQHWRKWFYILAIPNILLITGLRVHLIYKLVDPDIAYNKTDEFHGWDDFAELVTSIAGDRPVIANSYQMASKLSFYSGKTVPSINVHRRGNEYDLLQLDTAFYGREILFMHAYHMPDDTLIIRPDKEKVYLGRVYHYRNFRKVTITPDQPELIFKAGTEVSIPVTIINPYPYPLTDHPSYRNPVHLSYHIYKDHEYYEWDGLKTKLEQDIHSRDQQEMRLKIPEEPGIYELELCPVSRNFLWWQNWKRFRLTVLENQEE